MQRSYYIQLLVAWFLFAFLGVFARSIHLPMPVLLTIMFATSALICLMLKPGRIEWSYGAVIVGLILMADYLLFFLAFRRISFATTIALHYLGPIFVTLLAPVIVQERFKPKSLGFACISFLAVVVMCRAELIEDRPQAVAGIIFAALSGVTLSLNILSQRRFMKRTDNFKAAVLQYNLTMAFGFLILSIAWPNVSDLSDHGIAFIDIAYAIGAGVITSTAVLLFNSALRFIDADIVARMAFTEVAWVVLLGAVLYKEQPTLMQLCAVGVIFLMGYLAQREGRKRL